MKYCISFLFLILTVTGCAQTPSWAGTFLAPDTVRIAPVVVPELPDKLDFAGEAVPLENFDTRESLLREVMSNMYLHSRTTLTLLATTRYFPIIEPILKKYGIPNETFNNIKIGYNRNSLIALKHKLDEDCSRRKHRGEILRMRDNECTNKSNNT